MKGILLTHESMSQSVNRQTYYRYYGVSWPTIAEFVSVSGIVTRKLELKRDEKAEGLGRG